MNPPMNGTLFDELLHSVQQMDAIVLGKLAPARVPSVDLPAMQAPEDPAPRTP